MMVFKAITLNVKFAIAEIIELTPESDFARHQLRGNNAGARDWNQKR